MLRATKWDLMRTVAIDNLEKKRQPMWADALETVRRIEDEDLMDLAIGGGYAPPGPVMFVAKVAAVLAGQRASWLQFQNIISEKVRTTIGCGLAIANCSHLTALTTVHWWRGRHAKCVAAAT